MTDQPANDVRINISVPESIEAGVYANFVGIWHDAESFTMDFAAITSPPEQAEDERGASYVAVAGKVVSRVKIPPSQVFELMKGLEEQLSMWEVETGKRPADEPGGSGSL